MRDEDQQSHKFQKIEHKHWAVYSSWLKIGRYEIDSWEIEREDDSVV